MIDQEEFNNIAGYLRQNLPVYGAKAVVDALIRSGYDRQEILFVYNQIKPSLVLKKKEQVSFTPKMTGGKAIILTVAIILFVVAVILIVFSLSSTPANALFEVTNVSTVDVRDSSGISVGKVVNLKVCYKVVETQEEKSENVSVRIGEEFCIGENEGCGIIPIAFKDKRGEEHIILTLAGRTMVNLVQKNVDWVVAEQRENGVLFDGEFLLPGQTLGQINSVIKSDVYNNLTGVENG